MLGRSIFIAILGLGTLFTASAQDPVYSLFYLNKMALNPAYAGVNRDLNFSAISRIQWTGVPSKMENTTAALDVACPSNKLGFGLMFSHDEAGEGFLTKNQGNLVIAVHIPSRFSRNFFIKGLQGRKYIFSGGLSYGVSQRKVTWNSLVFSDQLDQVLGVYRPTSAFLGSSETSNLVHDLNAGLLFRSEISKKGSFISMGAAMYHLNSPVESFYGNNNKVPIRYSGHLYFNFRVSGKYRNGIPSFLTVGANIDHQATLQTMLLGGTYTFGTNILMGAWYRNQYFGLPNTSTNAVILNFVYSLKSMSFAYSFDITTSSLGLDQTFGTHEFGINIKFDKVYLCKDKSRRNRADLKCFLVDKKYMSGNDMINFLP